MDKIAEIIENVTRGFSELKVGDKYKGNALIFIEEWLTNPEFKAYVPQIEHIISQKDWDYLLDCFYQVIPFGTAGRRGEVGVGPNRINLWTVCSASQGHSQYLIKKYGENVNKRGIVIAYDVRIFLGNKHLDNNLKSPLTDLSARDLAEASARVYAANGMKVFIFDGIRTTPELSFAVKHLKAVAGAMYSASHNPPNYNGQKVFDEYGGQMIQPYDEELINEVTQNVREIKQIGYQQGLDKGLINLIGEKVDEDYIKAVVTLSHSDARDVKIVYTPLHGCGITSVPKAMEKLGFSVILDPKTSNPSGKFENITYNIPNPEVVESFDTSLECAKKENADILLNSDPDADRIGVMVNHCGGWVFLNGDQIASVLTCYIEEKTRNSRGGGGVMIKTAPTTGLMARICSKNNIELIGDLLIGYKYIVDEVNKLEAAGRIGEFLFACEESYGYSAGNYVREKDACNAAIWLSELTAQIKPQGRTIIDYLDDIYSTYGYFNNHQTEIRLLGAVGFERMDKIMNSLRKDSPANFGKFKIGSMEDGWNRLPFVSDTDKVAKNLLNFHIISDLPEIDSVRAFIRPSGTEPKLKIYFEIGAKPVSPDKLPQAKAVVDALMTELEKESMKAWYKIIGIDFPDRGFSLFWQLPIDVKMKYFQMEPLIEQLRNEPDKATRKQKLFEMISIFEPDPIGKTDKAFKEKNGVSMLEYLDLE